MTDKSSPEWTAVTAKIEDALRREIIRPFDVAKLNMIQSPAQAEKILAQYIREHGEFRLLRDMEQARLDSKRRWLTITGAMALGFAALVIIAYFISKP